MIPISYQKQIEAGIYEYAIDNIGENRIDTTALERKYKNDEFDFLYICKSTFISF